MKKISTQIRTHSKNYVSNILNTGVDNASLLKVQTLGNCDRDTLELPHIKLEQTWNGHEYLHIFPILTEWKDMIAHFVLTGYSKHNFCLFCNVIICH